METWPLDFRVESIYYNETIKRRNHDGRYFDVLFDVAGDWLGRYCGVRVGHRGTDQDRRMPRRLGHWKQVSRDQTKVKARGYGDIAS